MSKKNPIEKADYINKQYKEYLRSSFSFGNETLQQLFEKQILNEPLYKGPYIDLILPFERGKTLEELIDEGVINEKFRFLGDMHMERPLYYHQEEAIRKLNGNRNAVITTGTGSGKTECFLYPILNEILNELDDGNDESGIRALFLYPMNALVNDQMDRVRKILSSYPDITYGFYTGESQEKKSSKPDDIPGNELITREEIRENPPHLLFTNYSMLEYLLIRPDDAPIFKSKKLKNWKYIVLDEAHCYTGTKGIEISMLMRRLTGLADVKPNFILTSATLGEQGKSEKNIVDFAEKLTSSNFEQDDIIFSKRIHPNKKKLLYRVDSADYIKLKENFENIEFVNSIITDYHEGNYGNDVAEGFYNLLEKDANVYDLYLCLKDGSKNINAIRKNLNDKYADREIAALIDIINMAQKNGERLFDLKYHSFVRPIAGAYITLDENPKLSLTKTNEIDGMKAFELGNCKYCKAPYIFGLEKYDGEKDMIYLYQNGEIDIYENYGDNTHVEVAYYLLKDYVTEESEYIEKYQICAKCGAVTCNENLNANHCNCGSEYERTVFKVKKLINDTDNYDSTIFYNNINYCPACGRNNNKGLVKSLNLGKDAGTAVIAQLLYESMQDDSQKTKNKTRKKIGLDILNICEENRYNDEQENEYIKQILAFSDSRAQASFAATFFDSNQCRALRKRIILEVLKNNNYDDISVNVLFTQLCKIIKDNQLFDNGLDYEKNAWITILIDLLKVDGIFDGEGLGLYYFDLNLEVLDDLTDEEISNNFGDRYKLYTKEDFITLIKVIFSEFKIVPAISYENTGLSYEEKRNYLSYRRFDNYVALKSESDSDKSIKSIIPKNKRGNKFTEYVVKISGCNISEANELLENIFIIMRNLPEYNTILTLGRKRETYQINISNYVLKSYKKNKCYMCNKCGSLTPYNINNVCPKSKCDGCLIEVNPDEVLKDNFYRNNYLTRRIEPIIVKEHTAQLDKETQKKYQNEFKNKKINILSCSTTFEMGIDIGDLETVFLRNVPPTPANYVQRAGRAGRRKDSSAFILTYCSVSSHDYTYFENPEKMISGIINPPYFDVMNDKIIQRHLMSSCLGAFFKLNPQYFKSVDAFVLKGGFEKFCEFIRANPKKLNEYIDTKVIPEKKYSQYHNYKWIAKNDYKEEKLIFMIKDIRNIINAYDQAIEIASSEENYKNVFVYTKYKEKILKENIIKDLSNYGVIPRYGFPVDVVELQIYENGFLKNATSGKNRSGLTRDLKMAISEYAPDSEVSLDKKKYTSKYITLPKNGEFPRNYFYICKECYKMNVFYTIEGNKQCQYCGSPINDKMEFFIEPVYGFKTGKTKESNRKKPKRSYSGEVYYIGGGEKCNTIKISENIKLETSKNDELMVMNKSKFYMCPKCGYSDKTDINSFGYYIEKEHHTVETTTCSNKKLDAIRLGHRFKTDVVRIITPILPFCSDENDFSKALSFMYAFLEGMSEALEIERNDIDAILDINVEYGCYDILVYDNVPGGAGHCKRLMDIEIFKKVIDAALIKVTQNCCDKDTSCYNCLRNFYNQTFHNKLKRSYAIEVIKLLKKDYN